MTTFHCIISHYNLYYPENASSSHCKSDLIKMIHSHGRKHYIPHLEHMWDKINV